MQMLAMMLARLLTILTSISPPAAAVAPPADVSFQQDIVYSGRRVGEMSRSS